MGSWLAKAWKKLNLAKTSKYCPRKLSKPIPRPTNLHWQLKTTPYFKKARDFDEKISAIWKIKSSQRYFLFLCVVKKMGCNFQRSTKVVFAIWKKMHKNAQNQGFSFVINLLVTHQKCVQKLTFNISFWPQFKKLQIYFKIHVCISILTT